MCAASLKDSPNDYVKHYSQINVSLFDGMTQENTKKMERIQRRFHRRLCGSDCVISWGPRLSVRRTAGSSERLAERFFIRTLQPGYILHHMAPKFFRANDFRCQLCVQQDVSVLFLPGWQILWTHLMFAHVDLCCIRNDVIFIIFEIHVHIINYNHKIAYGMYLEFLLIKIQFMS